MTIQPINIGNVVNDGLGDDLRTAFEKVNANFTDLSTQLTITATNVGATGVGVFKEKVGADLKFKKFLNFTPKYSVNNGIKEIINYIKINKTDY